MGIRAAVAERPSQYTDLLRSFFEQQLISQDQYNAGTQYAEAALSYLESIDAPEPFGRDTWQVSGEGLKLSGDSNWLSEEECFRRKLIYSQARHTMRSPEQRSIVDKVAIYNEPPKDQREWDALFRGLTALINA